MSLDKKNDSKRLPDEISAIEKREDQFLIGRSEQTALFNRYIFDRAYAGKRIWNLYGTAGVGKSFLMDSFRRKGRQEGLLMLHLDSRDFNHKGEYLCRQLLQQMSAGNDDEGTQFRNPLETCLENMKRLAQETKIVLSIDTYEEMAELDGWLREQFVKRLPDHVLLLIAGRYKLRDQWILSPSVREQILFMPLDHLTKEDSTDYLLKSGIQDKDQMDRIWAKTKGHPLALSLAASVPMHIEWKNSSMDESDWFDQLVEAWLREVPSESLRHIVEAAGVLLHFNLELLNFVMEQDMDAETFNQLISLSFVSKTNRGWMLHDLMRMAARKQLEERTPSYFKQLTGRAAHYYAVQIRQTSPYQSAAWEVGELFYYTNSIVRALLQSASRGHYAWEPLTLSNLEEGEAYLRRRREEATPLQFIGSDPQTNQQFNEFEGVDNMKLTIKDLDLHALVKLDQQVVMMLRSETGEAIGISAIVPINKATLPYLYSDPFASPYLSSLSPEEQDLLEADPPGQAGWFIRTIDYADWQNQNMLIESIYLMFSYMCSGGLFVASPPPIEYMKMSHLSLGFQILPGVVHKNYDGQTPTPTFVLDTRGEKLETFLRFLLKRGGYKLETQLLGGQIAHLTEREREVISLVAEGLTNGEIAKTLYVSEITVKKHVSAIYNKLSVKNRNQLIKLLSANPRKG